MESIAIKKPSGTIRDFEMSRKWNHRLRSSLSQIVVVSQTLIARYGNVFLRERKVSFCGSFLFSRNMVACSVDFLFRRYFGPKMNSYT